jgi:hypothetical protein
MGHLLFFYLLKIVDKAVPREQTKDFSFLCIEFGTALTTILPILFQYCYKYCYSDSRNLWAVMKAGGLAL